MISAGAHPAFGHRVAAAARPAPESASAAFRNLDRQTGINADLHRQDRRVRSCRKAESQRRSQNYCSYHSSLPYRVESRITTTIADDKNDDGAFVARFLLKVGLLLCRKNDTMRFPGDVHCDRHPR
jgi:hypothetical protein